MTVVSQLVDRVHAEEGATQSLVTLVQGFNQALKDALAASDLTAIQAISDELDGNTQRIVDAVNANPLPATSESPAPAEAPPAAPSE